MSIEVKNEVKAVFTYPYGYCNIELNIEVTRDGLEIDGEILTWEWIDAARKAVTP
jgi:hypothetical protein